MERRKFDDNRENNSGRRNSSGGRSNFGGRSNSGGRGSFGGRNNFGGRGGFDRGPREMHKAICAKCKKECEVPFKPTEGRDVFCKDCFVRRG